jgi:Protein of unknown function (DUF3618)
MSSPDELKAEIEATRAELAQTADALAAKLDVKAQAKDRVHDVGDTVSAKYHQARSAAPEPVQKAIGQVGHAAEPVIRRAGEDKKRTALIVAGAVAALLVVRRIRK